MWHMRVCEYKKQNVVQQTFQARISSANSFILLSKELMLYSEVHKLSYHITYIIAGKIIPVLNF